MFENLGCSKCDRETHKSFGNASGLTKIEINDNDTINIDISGQRRIYFDNSGIIVSNDIKFYNSNSRLAFDTTTNYLDISGTNGIRFNKDSYIRNNNLGLGVRIGNFRRFTTTNNKHLIRMLSRIAFKNDSFIRT